LTLKEHEYRVMAEFIPISFAYNALAALERVERDSRVTMGGLIRAE